MMQDDIFALLKEVEARLTKAGIETARLDAELLLACALNCERLALYTLDTPEISRARRNHFYAMADRREQREPVAYILGEKEFWGLSFEVSGAVLIPRPDSETLIEAALAFIEKNKKGRDHPWHILDLGTGSGCLLIALLSELPNAAGLGADRSADALDVARRNAVRHRQENRCRLIKSNWMDDLETEGPFDLVLSNPPYIPAGDMAGLLPDVVRYEPAGALAGGTEGLDCYRIIAAALPAMLKRDGAAFFEIGAGQKSAVEAILCENGLMPTKIHRDLAGMERIFEATLP